MPGVESILAPRGQTAGRPRGAWRRRRWWMCLGALFVCFASWSVASPLMAPPDEAAHLLKAAAVARGQLFGHPEAPLPNGQPNPQIQVQVPAGFANADAIWRCYTLYVNRSASCAPTLHYVASDAIGGPQTASAGQLVTVTTYVGRYPPLYYLAVGWPSLLFPSATGVYLMRLVSALLSALFLASAFESALVLANRRLAVLGVAVAGTPMVFYLGGTINPNGLEISAAICAWASGLALVKDERPGVDRRLLARTAVSAAVLVQIRALSPLWLALLVLTLLAVVDRHRLAQVVRDRTAWWWAALVAACSGFALWWVIRFHSLTIEPGVTNPAPPSTPESHLVAIAFSFVDFEVRGMIGYLGRPDTPPPSLTVYLWLAMVAVLVGLGLCMGRRRDVAVLSGLIAATVLIPVAADAYSATRDGFAWQGRYTLPLAVGIPILAVAVAGRQPTPSPVHRLRFLIPVGAAVAQMALFVWGLWRYGVGEPPPGHLYHLSLDPFRGWQPPLGAAPVFLIFLVGLVGLSVWLIMAGQQSWPRGALGGLGQGSEETSEGNGARDPAGARPATPRELGGPRTGGDGGPR